jgi:hypothetical protein
VNANGSFKDRRAPCGRLCDGETYEDRDYEVVITQETFYSCGCESIQHEYPSSESGLVPSLYSRSRHPADSRRATGP